MGETRYHVRLLVLVSSHIIVEAGSFEEAVREAENITRQQQGGLPADVLAVHTDYAEEAS